MKVQKIAGTKTNVFAYNYSIIKNASSTVYWKKENLKHEVSKFEHEYIIEFTQYDAIKNKKNNEERSIFLVHKWEQNRTSIAALFWENCLAVCNRFQLLEEWSCSSFPKINQFC